MNSPAHYTSGTKETIDIIDEVVDDPASYYKGNIIKYISRHQLKGEPISDLKKADWYLKRLLELTQKELEEVPGGNNNFLKEVICT